MTKNTNVTEYINRLSSPRKEIAQAIRDMIVSKFPALNEDFKWSQPVYSDKNGYMCHFVANKNDVNLGFEQGASLNDPQHILNGTGKNMRHVKIKNIEMMDLDYYEKLLSQALSLHK